MPKLLITNFESKIADIQRTIKLKKIDGFLINNTKNIRYLTGFTGSSGFILITRDDGLFFTDFRYIEQAESEVRGCKIRLEKGRRINTIGRVIKKRGIKRLGFEASISYEFYELLRRLPITLKPLKNTIEKLRKLKDDEEINSIKRAVERAEKAFLKVKPKIKAGIKEKEISMRMEEQLKKGGCKSIPFDIIVASGRNSSQPHAKTTEKKIEKGDFVIIDWGGEADGYYSDMTRTFLMKGGDLSEKIKVYSAVNSARSKAIGSIKEGMEAKEIDSIARGEIKSKGYGDFFGHGAGHGVGMDVHEYPYISWSKGERIKSGMVFTIEPGVYIPSLGGVRIEDMVTVKYGSTVLLTNLSRDLEIIK